MTDDTARGPTLGETIQTLRKLAAGESNEESPPLDVVEAPLFASIAGAKIDVPSYRLAQGVTIRQVYAHIMSPYLVAFEKPPKKVLLIQALGSQLAGAWDLTATSSSSWRRARKSLPWTA